MAAGTKQGHKPAFLKQQIMKKAFALIIEDTELLAEYFAHVLQSAEYDTEIVGDGRQAQQRLQEVTPDMILLDLNLPYVSGEDLLAQIRSDKRLRDTRVIIASAEGTQAGQIREQADLVLQKPVDHKQLKIFVTKFHPGYRSAGLLNQA